MLQATRPILALFMVAGVATGCGGAASVTAPEVSPPSSIVTSVVTSVEQVIFTGPLVVEGAELDSGFVTLSSVYPVTTTTSSSALGGQTPTVVVTKFPGPADGGILSPSRANPRLTGRYDPNTRTFSGMNGGGYNFTATVGEEDVLSGTGSFSGQSLKLSGFPSPASAPVANFCGPVTGWWCAPGEFCVPESQIMYMTISGPVKGETWRVTASTSDVSSIPGTAHLHGGVPSSFTVGTIKIGNGAPQFFEDTLYATGTWNPTVGRWEGSYTYSSPLIAFPQGTGHGTWKAFRNGGFTCNVQ